MRKTAEMIIYGSNIPTKTYRAEYLDTKDGNIEITMFDAQGFYQSGYVSPEVKDIKAMKCGDHWEIIICDAHVNWTCYDNVFYADETVAKLKMHEIFTAMRVMPEI